MVRKLEMVNEEAEQYSRRNCFIRIYGIPESTNENTDNTVMGVINNKLKLGMPPQIIDRSQIQPRPLVDSFSDSQRSTPKPIIVKFVRYNVRQQVYNARKDLMKTAKKIFIRESLTSKRQQLVNELVRHDLVKRVWTQDGKIRVLTVDNAKCTVRSIQDLESARSWFRFFYT